MERSLTKLSNCWKEQYMSSLTKWLFFYINFNYFFCHFRIKSEWTKKMYEINNHQVCHKSTSSQRVIRLYISNVTFNNISAILRWSTLLEEVTEVPREYYRHIRSHWQTFFSKPHVVESGRPCHGWQANFIVTIGTDCIGRCKSNYHVIVVTNSCKLLL